MQDAYEAILNPEKHQQQRQQQRSAHWQSVSPSISAVYLHISRRSPWFLCIPACTRMTKERQLPLESGTGISSFRVVLFFHQLCHCNQNEQQNRAGLQAWQA